MKNWKIYLDKLNDNNLKNYIIDFLDYIPIKSIKVIELTDNINDILSALTKKKVIFIYDIEFQNKYRSNQRHILEMGGIIFLYIESKWVYFSNFHFNLPPMTSIRYLTVVQSKYGTTTPETNKKITEYEKKYLYYRTLQEYINRPVLFKNYYYSLPVKIKNIELKQENFPRIVKKYKDLSFSIGKREIGDTLEKVWKLYLQDEWVKNRTITPNKTWVYAFMKLLNKSLSVVKGNMDLLAINNLCRTKVHTSVYDIAMFNDKFRSMCKNAELEESYFCLLEKDYVDKELTNFFTTIYDDLKLKTNEAHNPLVDSFYTLVVAVVMSKLQNK
jgi:hypothetical protein